MSPSFWEQACKELSKNDPTLAKVIRTYRGEFLRTRGQPFETLARSIVGQQISVKAADTVWARLVELLRVHGVRKIQPEIILKLSTEDLRSCGLSARKVEYLKDLSQHFLTQKVHPKKWQKMTDEEIIEELTDIRGLGRWTVEMFLIFYLLRPNIFPVADIGLQKAVSKLYQKKYPPSKTALEKLRKQYHPWASVATWYLWRSLDPVPVEY